MREPRSAPSPLFGVDHRFGGLLHYSRERRVDVGSGAHVSVKPAERRLRECSKIPGISARNQVPVLDNLRIDERGTGVLNVLDNRGIAGNPATLKHLRGNQQLRCVADDEDGFAAFDESTHKIYDMLVDAQFVR